MIKSRLISFTFYKPRSIYLDLEHKNEREAITELYKFFNIKNTFHVLEF